MKVIDTQKELKEMRAEERKVANDKLKYPKITGRTYTLSAEGFDHARNDAMRVESSNPFN